MVQQGAVNYIVLVLSCLHLNRPRVAPVCLHLQSKLDKKQWAIVHCFERQLAGVAETDAVGPSQGGELGLLVGDYAWSIALGLSSDNYLKLPF